MASPKRQGMTGSEHRRAREETKITVFHGKNNRRGFDKGIDCEIFLIFVPVKSRPIQLDE